MRSMYRYRQLIQEYSIPTVISGYVATVATQPPMAPDTPSTTASDAIVVLYCLFGVCYSSNVDAMSVDCCLVRYERLLSLLACTMLLNDRFMVQILFQLVMNQTLMMHRLFSVWVWKRAMV